MCEKIKHINNTFCLKTGQSRRKELHWYIVASSILLLYFLLWRWKACTHAALPNLFETTLHVTDLSQEHRNGDRAKKKVWNRASPSLGWASSEPPSSFSLVCLHHPICAALSFHPSVRFVTRLMLFSPTPFKPYVKVELNKSYLPGLKTMCGLHLLPGLSRMVTARPCDVYDIKEM